MTSWRPSHRAISHSCFCFHVKSLGSGLRLFRESKKLGVTCASGSIPEFCLKVLKNLFPKSPIDLAFLCLWSKIIGQSIFKEQTLRTASYSSCSTSTAFLTSLISASQGLLGQPQNISTLSFPPKFLCLRFLLTYEPIDINLGFPNYRIVKQLYIPL